MTRKIIMKEVWTEAHQEDLDDTLFLGWLDPEGLEEKTVHTVLDISSGELRELFSHAITLAKSGICPGEQRTIEEEIFELLGIEFYDMSGGH